MKREVVLVDSNDQELGVMEIEKAHHNPGTLHRAISVCLSRKKRGKYELLLQQRSQAKPLWPFSWSNTVCTHPYLGEKYLDTAQRRLKEELGIRVELQDMNIAYSFIYQANFNSQWSEYELDTVIVGEFDDKIWVNPNEVSQIEWVEIGKLLSRVKSSPEQYTPWFKLILERFKNLEFKLE